MKTRLFWSALALTLWYSPLAAQTAEETVAFLVKGVEEHHEIGDFEVSHDQQGTLYKLEKQHDDRYFSAAVRVKKRDGCRYIVSSRIYDDRERIKVELLDFSKIDKIIVRNHPEYNFLLKSAFFYIGSGYRATFPDSESSLTMTMGIGLVAQDRVDKAVSYMRREFCKKKAF